LYILIFTFFDIRREDKILDRMVYNNNNNYSIQFNSIQFNSILYYLCAESTATRPNYDNNNNNNNNSMELSTTREATSCEATR
jgi:hypothetical protein